tara:strand:+ start:143 stop:1045 length:903 start_codon:yes stop_codon:yes gene_type:complete
LPKSIKDWYNNLGIEGSMQIAGIVMVVPAILLLLMLLVAPFGYIIFASFIEKGSQGFSFGNYAWLSSPLFLPSFRNSLIIGVGSVLLEIIIAVPLAILLNQKMYLRGLWRALITLPWAVPTIAVAGAFLWLGNPHYGIFNQIGLEIGLLKTPLAFFGDPDLALLSVIVAHAWKGLPLVFIIVFASLQSLPEEQIEASKIDGAGKLRQLQYVILPHLKTSIALAAVLSGAYNFSLFDLTFLLTGGGPAGLTMGLPMLEYNQMFRSLNIGRAAVIGMTIFFSCIVALSALFVLMARDRAKRT